MQIGARIARDAAAAAAGANRRVAQQEDAREIKYGGVPRVHPATVTVVCNSRREEDDFERAVKRGARRERPPEDAGKRHMRHGSRSRSRSRRRRTGKGEIVSEGSSRPPPLTRNLSWLSFRERRRGVWLAFMDA